MFLQGESAQVQLQKAQQQQQALQETLAQAEKQRQAVEARLQLHVQQESGMMAMLAEDFSLSCELQQKLSGEGEAHAAALRELRNQVTHSIQPKPSPSQPPNPLCSSMVTFSQPLPIYSL